MAVARLLLPSLLVLSGPTGVGKSETAVEVALAIGAEIVNYDSIQIYRGFDIGSAKPRPELRGRVPHHLFDIIEADQEFTAAAYARAANRVCEEIRSRGRIPLLVGGTGFYLQAFLSGLPEMVGSDEEIRRRLREVSNRSRGPERLHRWLTRVDPETGRRVAAGDRHRVERALEVYIQTGKPISSWRLPSRETPAHLELLQIALTMPRERLIGILDDRVRGIYRAGLVEETRQLLDRYPAEARPFGAIGYREAVQVVSGSCSVEHAIAETMRRTRAYAKRQMTWLRAEQGVQWVEATPGDESSSKVLEVLKRREGSD